MSNKSNKKKSDEMTEKEKRQITAEIFSYSYQYDLYSGRTYIADVGIVSVTWKVCF